jgi:hypothetical protein
VTCQRDGGDQRNVGAIARSGATAAVSDSTTSGGGTDATNNLWFDRAASRGRADELMLFDASAMATNVHRVGAPTTWNALWFRL